jgi:hypothetical protein
MKDEGRQLAHGTRLFSWFRNTLCSQESKTKVAAPAIANSRFGRRSRQDPRNKRGETANRAVSPYSSNGLQVLSGRFAGLAVDHNLERDALTFSQFAQSGTLDGADMNEHIFTAAFGLDKSITLLRVEPFHGSVAHGTLLFRIKI